MPQRCVYWRDRNSLIAADLHLGKSEAMGVAGVPIPAGISERQLERLSSAIEATGASRVIVVGDLLHAPAGLTEGLIETVGEWRRRCPVEFVVVPGNHDRRLGDLADLWRLTVTGMELADGPFVFRHEPIGMPRGAGFWWFGHLHPAVHLRAGGDRLKLPCFHVGAGRAVLPAFSPFTAGGSLPRVAGDRVFAAAGDRVIEV